MQKWEVLEMMGRWQEDKEQEKGLGKEDRTEEDRMTMERRKTEEQRRKCKNRKN